MFHFFRRRDSIVHIETTPDEKGYWLYSRLGKVFPFGNAYRYTPYEIKVRNKKRSYGTGLVVTPRGAIFVQSGYQPDCGGMMGKHLNAPIVDAISNQRQTGYWLVAADGGVFTFGDVGFFGSTGHTPKNYGIKPSRRTSGRTVCVFWKKADAPQPQRELQPA